MSAFACLSDIPHPPGIPLFGNLFTVDRTAAVQGLMALARKYGPIFRLEIMGRSIIFVSGPDLVDELCDQTRFTKSLKGKLGEMRKVAGDGLLTAETDEPNWRKAHNILLPNFSQNAMRGYHSVMIEVAAQLLLKWDRLNTDDEIDVIHDMTSLTFETIGLCGFGYRFNSFYRERNHPFVEALIGALDTTMRARGLPKEELLYWRRESRLKNCISTMNAMVDRIISERRQSNGDDAGKTDLLSHMLTGVDKKSGEPLSDLNIRYQIITFLSAGHETTSGLLSFAIYYLTRNRAVVARCQEEVDRMLGSDRSVQPTYEQINQLSYIRQVLKETLRLWPTAPAFTIMPLSDTVIGGRYSLKRGQQITILSPILHRDMSVWGEQSEVFNPENFNPEAEESRPPNSYKPFGNGQRACIGQQFAMHEAALVLGMILHRFHLSTGASYELKIKETLTIKPDGLQIKARWRHPTNEVPTAPPATASSTTTASSPPPQTAAKHAIPLLVLFGSNMGTSEATARQIGEDGQAAGFSATVATLDEYCDRLPTTGLVVIVTSSYNGTPPDNALAFCGWLNELSGSPLAGVRYTIFGCGNRDWAQTFQAVPRRIDERLRSLGAHSVFARGEGDQKIDYEGQFRLWYKELWAAVAKEFSLDLSAHESSPESPLFTIEISSQGRKGSPVTPLAFAPMFVHVNRELQTSVESDRPERSTRHIEVELPEGISYRAGDHIGVMPQNNPELVSRLASRLGLKSYDRIKLTRTGDRQAFLPIDEWIGVDELLGQYVEIQAPATRTEIKLLANHTRCPDTASKLAELAEDNSVADDRYRSEVLSKHKSVLDLLEEFPACEVPFETYLERASPLSPRYYSISSSALISPRRCSLTVAVFKAPARSGKGSYEGTCSNYLARIPQGATIQGLVKDSKSNFRLPSDPAVPTIMVGPGTGLAPFRGFLQERAALKAQGQNIGPSLLFFGCRHPERDFIYKEELRGFGNADVVELYTAFSRFDDTHKTYVQQSIIAAHERVWEFLEAGAVVYVCGDAAKMAPDVRLTFAHLYQSRTGTSVAESEEWLQEMIENQRYRVDVWASN